ncbi:MAG: SusC/RagA family TonB-linked outer membrane protein, partial [Bacteroidales bacterium]
IGTPTVPEVLYGFGPSIGFKGFDFSFFLQGSGRSSFFIDPDKITPFVNRANILDIIAKDHWTPESPELNTFWPRLSTTTIENNKQLSTWWLRDGRFLRIKSVELGYTFPEQWMKKACITKLRIYLTGNNLYCFSKFDLWDPEMGGNGLKYPLQRVYNVGLQLSF